MAPSITMNPPPVTLALFPQSCCDGVYDAGLSVPTVKFQAVKPPGCGCDGYPIDSLADFWQSVRGLELNASTS